jgi:hypothetical protein
MLLRADPSQAMQLLPFLVQELPLFTARRAD